MLPPVSQLPGLPTRLAGDSKANPHHTSPEAKFRPVLSKLNWKSSRKIEEVQVWDSNVISIISDSNKTTLCLDCGNCAPSCQEPFSWPCAGLQHCDNTISSYEWQTNLLTTRNGHGQSGWSPIGCEGFHTNLNIRSPLPTTLVFR